MSSPHAASGPAADLGERLSRRLEPDALIILDIRDAPAFAAGHLPGSGNLPVAQWEARRSELPPRETQVLVVADSPTGARDAAKQLESLGYPRARALETDVGASPDARDISPAWPLWRPTPYLASALERFGKLVPQGPAADLASGAGRDAVFLALRGFEVEAWDRAPEALARACELARSCGVRITAVECDLEHDRPPLAPARYALLTCFRFLDRRLLARMSAALLPGGILVYETFRSGQERFGRPTHAQFLLAPGELQAAFAGLEILHHEERTPPEGPITAGIAARRR